MTWGAVAGAAIGVVGSAMTSKSGGGAGSSTTDKSPWVGAEPWILSNMTSGQNLENNYLANPQSAQQTAATNSIYGQNAYTQSLVPSLLGQLQGQPVGYTPSADATSGKTSFTPGANAATPWNWNAGLLASSQQPAAAAVAAPAVAAPAPAAPMFTQNTQSDPSIANFVSTLGQAPTQGGYGTFKYGDTPAKGSQQYLDLQNYLLAGGSDPMGLYTTGPGQGGYGPATSVGDGVGVAGSAAAVGSSANF